MIRPIEPTTLNPFVTRQPDGTLHFDGVDLGSVAKQFGTPVWVCSAVAGATWRVFARQPEVFPHCRHAYGLKANTTSSLVKALVDSGCDLDVSSETELARGTSAFRAGCSRRKLQIPRAAERCICGWRSAAQHRSVRRR